MSDAIINLLNSNAFSGIGGLLIGLIAGQRLQLWLSRRSEYNELADALFLRVDREVSATDGHWFHLPEDEIKLLRRRMGVAQRRRFDTTMGQFEVAASKTKTDDSGQVHFTDTQEINRTLKLLAALLHRK